MSRSGIGLSSREYQRDEVTLGYLEQSALAGLATPQVLVDPLVDWVGERRRISYALLTEGTLPEIADPTEEELRAFYEGAARRVRAAGASGDHRHSLFAAGLCGPFADYRRDGGVCIRDPASVRTRLASRARLLR